MRGIHCSIMARVVNMTVLCRLCETFDLRGLAARDGRFVYDPHIFTAARFRSGVPKYTAALFANGHVTLTGVKTRLEAVQAIKHFCRVLSGVVATNVECVSLRVANHVGTFDAGQKLCLVELYAHLRDNGCTYETELFPGLIFPCKSLGVTITFFASGKVNFTGFKRIQELRRIQTRLEFIVANYRTKS